MKSRDGLVPENISMGRINCKNLKAEVCDRLVRNRKFPILIILSEDKAYDFSKGNFTTEYLTTHIMEKNFISEAEEKAQKKDEEGLTFKNYNKHSVYKIKALVSTKKGGKWTILVYTVKEHTKKFKSGVELIAKTYGIRRIIKDDANIWPACVLMACCPFMLLMVVMLYEARIMKANKALKTTAKTVEEKEKKDK